MFCNSEELNDTIKAQIDEADRFPISNGHAPAVYSARIGHNRYHVGWNFQPVGTQAGETFIPVHPRGFIADPIIHWVKQ